MQLEAALSILRQHETELKARGVRHAAVFGSVARATERPGSGNVYRHDYQLVGDDFVFRTIEESLPALAAVVEAELRLMEGHATDGP